jgi:hypothetical protein
MDIFAWWGYNFCPNLELTKKILISKKKKKKKKKNVGKSGLMVKAKQRVKVLGSKGGTLHLKCLWKSQTSLLKD